jgi:hypothetical protein
LQKSPIRFFFLFLLCVCWNEFIFTFFISFVPARVHPRECHRESLSESAHVCSSIRLILDYSHSFHFGLCASGRVLFWIGVIFGTVIRASKALMFKSEYCHLRTPLLCALFLCLPSELNYPSFSTGKGHNLNSVVYDVVPFFFEFFTSSLSLLTVHC